MSTFRFRSAGPPPVRRLGLDAEALPYVSWGDKAYWRHTLCWGWGTADDVRYIETIDRRPGRFQLRGLSKLRQELTEPDVVVVGHNVGRYDLPLLNGVLIEHDLEPLPILLAQDTMSDWKLGGAFKNNLKSQCERLGVQHKSGSPNWDLVMQGDPDEWAAMQDYNINDVVCTLQLERALFNKGLPCPVKRWKPRKGR